MTLSHPNQFHTKEKIMIYRSTIERLIAAEHPKYDLLQINRIVSEFLNQILEKISSGETVCINGFGKFYKYRRTSPAKSNFKENAKRHSHLKFKEGPSIIQKLDSGEKL